MQGVQHQFHADEGENGGQAVGEVDQAVQQPVDQEVELAQAHQGERGGGEDNEGALGQSEDRRDRVQREKDVGAADGDHHQEHRGEDLLAVFHGEQLVAVVVIRGGQHALGDPDDEVVCLVLLAFRLEQVARGNEQDQAEDVENPGEGVDQGCAEENEAGPGDQREDDAEEQDLLLILTRYPEARHDDQEDKEVVHRQGFFRDVASEILGAGDGSAEHQDQDAKDDGQAHVDGGPDGRLFERGNVRLADVEEIIKGQQAEDDDNRHAPDQGGNSHGESAFVGYAKEPQVSPAACGRPLSPAGRRCPTC